jgi:hypothetical protein
MSLTTMSIKVGDLLFAGLLNVNTYTGKRARSDYGKAQNVAANARGLETCAEYTIDGYLIRITNAQATIVRLSDSMPLAYATLHDLAAVGAHDHAEIVLHMYRAVSSTVRTI